VNGAGDEFLAGAAFAFDQDGGAGGCDLLDRLDDRLHHFGLAEDAFDGEFALHLLLQRHVFVLQRAAAEGAFDEELHFIEIERLGDKMVGPAAHRLHGGVHAAVGGHHDADRRFRQG
jgi:hypothetical protein